MAIENDKLQHPDRWLDGLAGRQPPHAHEGAVGNPETARAAAAALDEGARLRRVLHPPVAAAEETNRLNSPSDADWQALLNRALPAAAANEPSAPATAPDDVPPVRTAAARSPWPGRAWAAAASVAALAVLVSLAPRGTDETVPGSGDTGLRGDASSFSGSSPATATWRSARPAEEAEQLAAELRAAGALVHVQAQPAGVLLQVNAPLDARAATNLLLAPLETALGVDGKLQLQVLPAAPTGTGPKP